jgi:hypothetical protein
MPNEIAKGTEELTSVHCNTVWSSIFDVLLGEPSFAMASSRVDMPEISSVTLSRQGEKGDEQDVTNQNAKRRRAIEFNIAHISPKCLLDPGKWEPRPTQPGALRALSPLIRRSAFPLS